MGRIRRLALLVGSGSVASVLGTGAGMGVLPAAAQRSSPPVVTNAVQVTADPNPVRAHASPQIARNPRTGELVIIEGDVRGNRECKVYVSTDDGRSWSPGGLPLRQPYTDCAFKADWGPYATMAFDRNGTLFVAIEASDPKLFNDLRSDVPRNLFLARSTDSGRTFEIADVFLAPAGNPDKGINKGATVAVDPKNSNLVYVGWRQGNQNSAEKLKTQVAASSDGGRTWGPPVDVSDSRGGDFPWLTVTPDGVVHAATWTRVFPAPATGQPNPVRELFHVSSGDRGKTWDRHTIDPGNQQHEHPPVLASNPATGALYAVWSAQPSSENQATGYMADLELYFRSSTDGGKTWSDKLTLNDDGPGKANQIDPGIAVAPNGRIDVAWYDSRHNPGALANRTETGFNDVYATWSTDGGRTFAPNVRVSDRSADRSIGIWANNIDQRLNVGVASSNAAAYFAWSDTRKANREFQPEDVYMASVQFEPSPVGGEDDSSGTPLWLAAGSGLALGMGLAMVAVWLLRSRAGAAGGTVARAPATTL